MMDRTTTLDIYTYADTSWSSLDLSGYHVEATDGEIGTIDDSTYEVGADSLIVDTGPWIFGQKVMIPAGTVSRVDEGEHRIWLNLTKDQIKKAPSFDESRWNDRGYRDELGTYYTANRPAGPDYGADDRPFNG